MKKIPKFRTEAEEANWWAKNPDAITERFREAKATGTLRCLSEARGAGSSETVTIRIPARDIQRARTNAASRGLRYQTYIKMLLHEGLERDERRPVR